MSSTSAAAVTHSAAGISVLVLDAPAAAEHIIAGLTDALPRPRIAHAADRRQFLDWLHSSHWSLVIASFDLNGYAGTDALRDAQLRTRAPVIAVGTAPATAEVVAALRDGAADFIDRACWQDLLAAANRLATEQETFRGGASDENRRFAQAAAWLTERNAMLLLDKDGVVTHCSGGVAAVLGYEPQDLVGQPIEALFVDVSEATAVVHRLRAWSGAELFRDSAWMARRDGLRLRTEMTCVADSTTGGRPQRYCLTVRDVTLQYRASQAMRSQADGAAAATVARNLFLGSIAHEVRAALAPISTSVLLLERRPEEPRRHEHLVSIIRRSAMSAAKLVDDLLLYSTGSENKLAMQLLEVDVHELVIQCTDAARQQASSAGVALGVEFAAAPAHARLQCDPDRIRQVMVNLVANAIKFTPSGGSVLVRTRVVAENLEIEVADSGVGIEPAALPFIFEPFEQGGSDVTNRFGGFGLGLAISVAIARQHGGGIEASSAGRGRGSTFRLRLPLANGVAPAGTGSSRNAPALHVLYVEDDPDAADAMQYALGTLGWTMTHAPTCASARELLSGSEHEFDVMLADLGLPDGSGLELGSELSRHLPVVALSAYGAPMAMQGFTNQLIKPAEIAEVQRSLLQAVAGRRSSTIA